MHMRLSIASIKRIKQRGGQAAGRSAHGLGRVDGKGAIAREEALAACAMWKHMVMTNATKSDTSSGCCVII